MFVCYTSKLCVMVTNSNYKCTIRINMKQFYFGKLIQEIIIKNKKKCLWSRYLTMRAVLTVSQYTIFTNCFITEHVFYCNRKCTQTYGGFIWWVVIKQFEEWSD